MDVTFCYNINDIFYLVKKNEHCENMMAIQYEINDYYIFII